jgi:hypothetical protein
MQAALGKAGAAQVALDYANGGPSGLGFTLPTPYGPRSFALPVNVDAVHRLLAQQAGKNSRVKADRAQSERVAWRIVRDWLFAQLALIEAEQASLDQVMLPYLRVDDSHTLYDAYRARDVAMIEAGEG